MSNENKEDSKTLLITGGAGFIGSNFIRYLLSKLSDIYITNYDKLTYAGNLENLGDIENDERYIFIRGDISSREAVDKLFKDKNYDIIVNFAAESHVDRSLLDATPFIETNINGTLVLLEAAREYNIKRFIHISTDEVYGSLDESGKFTEESPLNPSSPYSASKASADLICQSFNASYDTPVIITRSSNNYGPYQFPEKLIPLIIKNALENKILPVYGDGKNIRDWIFVMDNCRAIYNIMINGKIGEIYNIGGGNEIENIKIVNMVCDVMAEELNKSPDKFKKLIEFVKDPRGNAHDFRYSLDTCKINEELGWKPTTDFSRGLRETVKWYLNNKYWIKNIVSGEYLKYYSKLSGK